MHRRVGRVCVPVGARQQALAVSESGGDRAEAGDREPGAGSHRREIYAERGTEAERKGLGCEGLGAGRGMDLGIPRVGSCEGRRHVAVFQPWARL